MTPTSSAWMSDSLPLGRDGFQVLDDRRALDAQVMDAGGRGEDFNGSFTVHVATSATAMPAK